MMTEIFNNFDFEKIQSIMVLLGITFPNPTDMYAPRHIPSVDELKFEAKHLLEEAWLKRSKWPNQSEEERADGVGGGCGCLSVEITWEGFELKFHPITSASYFADHGKADGYPDENK